MIELTTDTVREKLLEVFPGAEKQIDEYIKEAEHMDGKGCWSDLYGNDLAFIASDFLLYGKS